MVGVSVKSSVVPECLKKMFNIARATRKSVNGDDKSSPILSQVAMDARAESAQTQGGRKKISEHSSFAYQSSQIHISLCF